MFKTSIFKIQINCPGCNLFINVTSLGKYQTCQNCGRNVNIGHPIRSTLFKPEDSIKYLNSFLSGNFEMMGSSGLAKDSGTYKLVYSSMPVYCEECFTVIDENELLNAINLKQSVKCINCGHPMPVKIADSTAKEIHPKMIAVINDSEGIDSSTKRADKKTILVFSCMSCGAGLEIGSDSKRTIKCTYCNNENYLPDAIWTKLHPYKEVSPLFAIFDIDENDLKESIDFFFSNVTYGVLLDRHFENFFKEYFEKPFFNVAFGIWIKFFLNAENQKKSGIVIDIEKIQKLFYNYFQKNYNYLNILMREVVVLNGKKIPIELQYLIASDSEASIKVKLAGNNSIDKDVLKKLKNDSDPSVSSAVKKQKSGFFGKLFG